MKIYVIYWVYDDGSATGIVKAFSNKEKSDKLLETLIIHGDQSKTFRISETILDDV